MWGESMKLYDIVKRTLESNPRYRNSDTELTWRIWANLGYAKQVEGDWIITYFNYKKAPSGASIRRARRKIQELHPELGATDAKVKQERGKKADQKGTHIFRETL